MREMIGEVCKKMEKGEEAGRWKEKKGGIKEEGMDWEEGGDKREGWRQRSQEEDGREKR